MALVRTRLNFCIAICTLLALALLADPALAQPAAPEAAEETASAGLLQILFAGFAGTLFTLLMLGLSVAAVALVMEHLLTIRAKVLLPPDLADSVRQNLQAGRVADALNICQAQPSLLSSILYAGLSEVENGWTEVEKAMEEALAEQSARLLRKIEYLSLIGNIAPMLGLLGTAIGMIAAFREVADTQGAANAGDLAEGIYLALVTTVEGLIIAIPSMAAFAIFRNRVDQLVAEAAYAAQHAVAPVKRKLMVAAKGNPPRPPKVGEPV